jgi:hypothetical protein
MSIRQTFALLALAGLLAGFDFGAPAQVRSLLALRDLSRSQVREALAPAQVDEHVAYQKLAAVDAVSNSARWPGRFYFRGDKLVMVYLGSSSKGFLDGLDEKKITAELGGPGHGLRSRAGKTSNQHVYPDRGFAYSEENGKLDFVEVFPPMTLPQYLDTIYTPVGPFTR